ncbi:MAG: zf-HC2 domain-containing protein [Thermodesulfobacteriota bacterium]
MDEPKIDRLLSQALASGQAAPGSACPSEEALAAFLEGRLRGRPREEMEGHLAQCRSCRELLALVQGAGAADSAEEAPAEWVRQAAALAGPAPAPRPAAPGLAELAGRLRHWLSAPRLVVSSVAAAVLLVGLYTVLHLPSGLQQADHAPIAGPPPASETATRPPAPAPAAPLARPSAPSVAAIPAPPAAAPAQPYRPAPAAPAPADPTAQRERALNAYRMASRMPGQDAAAQAKRGALPASGAGHQAKTAPASGLSLAYLEAGPGLDRGRLAALIRQGLPALEPCFAGQAGAQTVTLSLALGPAAAAPPASEQLKACLDQRLRGLLAQEPAPPAAARITLTLRYQPPTR